MVPNLPLLLAATPPSVSAAGDLQTGARTDEAQVAPLATLLQGDVVVSLANNHALDQGPQGLAETVELIESLSDDLGSDARIEGGRVRIR